MFKLVKRLVIGVVLTMGWVNGSVAASCLNEKVGEIIRYQEISPGDVNRDGKEDTLIINLEEDWLVLQIFTNNKSLDDCNPNLKVKFLGVGSHNSPVDFDDLHGWETTISINKKGNIKFKLSSECRWCRHGGIPRDYFNLTFRYLDNGLQLIGYDLDAFGVFEDGYYYSVNLLTGKVIRDKYAGLMQTGNERLERKEIDHQFNIYLFEDGDEIIVPEEISQVLELLN